MNKLNRNDIASEWDTVCLARQNLIDNGCDPSLIWVNIPCIIRNLPTTKVGKILDIGCGTGYLTNELLKFSLKCVGIDISKKSIDIACSRYNEESLNFYQSSICDFRYKSKFDLCVANMVFSSDPEFNISIKNVFNLLKKNGHLLLTLPHPCFWPKYWGYEKEDWYDYNSEIYVKNNFHTSWSNDIGFITQIHRPITMYLNNLIDCGFQIIKIEEPLPIKGFPQNYVYEYPRFLFIKCKKIN